MNEQWVIWNPASTPYEYGIEKIVYSRPKLTIVLYPWRYSTKQVTLIFNADVINYGFTEDGYVTHMPQHQEYEETFLASSNFFKVLNSTYVQNLSDELGNPQNTKDFMHFVIDSIDGTIDIVSRINPIITEVDCAPKVKKQ